MQVPAAPLARPAAPAGAPNHPWQPCSVGLNRPAAATCPPLQLLATEPTLGLPGSPTSCPAASDHFDCLGDALEEQAKLLEELDFCPASPAAAVRAAVQPSPASALCAAGLDALHLDPATDEDDAAVQYAMAAAAAAAAEQRAAGSASADGAAVASGGGEPCTPQRHSGHDSSWNESPLGTSGLDYGEVQSPAPLPLIAAAPAPAAARRPPLQMAIDNAQRVRLGHLPTPGAWRGCGRSAWCSLKPTHFGGCNATAVVPGLLAYPSQELFESGVNIEELCRVPDELAAHLIPDDESEGCTEQAACAAGDALSSGKRRAEEGCEEGATHSQSLSGCGGTASSGAPGEGEDQCSAGSRAAKRARGDASNDAVVAAVGALALGMNPAMMPPELRASAVSLAVAVHEGPACSRMVPVPVPQPEPEPAQPAAAPSSAVPKFAPPVPPVGSAAARNRGRPAGAPRLKPLPPPPPPPPPAPVAHLPSKPVTRQRNMSHPFAASSAPSAPRTSGRRTVLQWHTDNVVDPRTGAMVSEVSPGTFCTQCSALSTPVWRAGPFGHKTLCNACGVRWMKYSKGKK